MKGKDAERELADAQNAIVQLGGKLIAKHDFILGSAGERSIIEIEKDHPHTEELSQKK